MLVSGYEFLHPRRRPASIPSWSRTATATLTTGIVLFVRGHSLGVQCVNAALNISGAVPVPFDPGRVSPQVIGRRSRAEPRRQKANPKGTTRNPGSTMFTVIVFKSEGGASQTLRKLNEKATTTTRKLNAVTSRAMKKAKGRSAACGRAVPQDARSSAVVRLL